MNFSKCIRFAACLATLGLLNALGWSQSYPPAFSRTASYASGDQVQAAGNIYRAITAVSPNPSGNPTGDPVHWELYYVRANTTLLIPSTFPDLATAWRFIQNATIAGGNVVRLYFDGTT